MNWVAIFLQNLNDILKNIHNEQYWNKKFALAQIIEMILWYWFPIKDHLKTYPNSPKFKDEAIENIENENIKEKYPKFFGIWGRWYAKCTKL